MCTFLRKPRNIWRSDQNFMEQQGQSCLKTIKRRIFRRIGEDCRVYGQDKHGTVRWPAKFADRTNDMNCVDMTIPVGQNKFRKKFHKWHLFLTFMLNLSFKQILWDGQLQKATTYSNITKIQRYTIVFIIVNALHVWGGSSAHHQELKTVQTASGICRGLLLLTAIVVGLF